MIECLHLIPPALSAGAALQDIYRTQAFSSIGEINGYLLWLRRLIPPISRQIPSSQVVPKSFKSSQNFEVPSTPRCVHIDNGHHQDTLDDKDRRSSLELEDFEAHIQIAKTHHKKHT
jgi:hypothetical protein